MLAQWSKWHNMHTMESMEHDTESTESMAGTMAATKSALDTAMGALVQEQGFDPNTIMPGEFPWEKFGISKVENV